MNRYTCLEDLLELLYNLEVTQLSLDCPNQKLI